MTTINISKEAYRIVLEKKQELEEVQQKVVSTADALDDLLGVKKDVED